MKDINQLPYKYHGTHALRIYSFHVWLIHSWDFLPHIAFFFYYMSFTLIQISPFKFLIYENNWDIQWCHNCKYLNLLPRFSQTIKLLIFILRVEESRMRFKIHIIESRHKSILLSLHALLIVWESNTNTYIIYTLILMLSPTWS